MQRSVEIVKAEVPSSAVLEAQIADGSETQVRLPTWWQDHCQRHRQTVMVPTASTDVVQSTESPRKRKRRLQCASFSHGILRKLCQIEKLVRILLPPDGRCFSMAIVHGWIQRLGVQFCGSVMGTQKQNLSNDVDLLLVLSFNKKIVNEHDH